MGLFNLGKKGNHAADNPDAEPADSTGRADTPPPEPASLAETVAANPTPAHEAVTTDIGPYDGDRVAVEEFDFTDFAEGVLDLGSVKMAVPKGSQVQVEMGENGPKMLHVLTPHGRLTPVAFAAPRSAGQWDESLAEIAESMENDGLMVAVERGPWGNEVVGRAANAVIRLIGVDGPRWLLRTTVASPVDSADEMATLARECIARSFVYRGSDPIPAGTSLPVVLPEDMADQLRTMVAQQQAKKSGGAPKLPNNHYPPQQNAPSIPAMQRINTDLNNTPEN
ncbi:DUF3710 domain-containing protein [Corynebacterium mendelii]|uniref:DUF3710 domain-containing protein n=1 Tax=Corynebacterium mendelii TaxID=2765362 RepID=A0A939E0Q8_9CORY|nr:DUF3710 domain-containing protein [Corynebacterium mendelii]MBN9643352.1 DUF3710 domain-containing protein [Corynebacterium mendelii]